MTKTEEIQSDKNCLSYWFPILESAGVPVPKTKILRMPEHAAQEFREGLNGTELRNQALMFACEVNEALMFFGNPAFLRTGQTSGKHSWKKTCCVKLGDSVSVHMLRLIEYSEMAGFLGLPWDVWVAREMLPTKSQLILEEYGGMPVVQEVRCFIKDGEIVCHHPYWPKQAILEGMRVGEIPGGVALRKILSMVDQVYHRLCNYGEDWKPIAQQVAHAFKFKGAWSVDLLNTAKGWYVTDMAEAARSFHWEGCKHNEWSLP